MPQTPVDACFATLVDRKYYNISNTTFMKRTLRLSEWSISDTKIDDKEWKVKFVPPISMRYRLRNEAACLQYLSGTGIPIPAFRGLYEEDGVTHLLTEYIEGKPMSHLEDADRAVVQKELDLHIATLQSLRSKTSGIPGSTLVCPHYEFNPSGSFYMHAWKLKDDVPDEKEEYVFCHMDLGQHNVLVDPGTLKIKAIIDWEFSGFFPRWFERPYWTKRGSAWTVGDEDRLRDWLTSRYDEFPACWPADWLKPVGYDMLVFSCDEYLLPDDIAKIEELQKAEAAAVATTLEQEAIDSPGSQKDGGNTAELEIDEDALTNAEDTPNATTATAREEQEQEAPRELPDEEKNDLKVSSSAAEFQRNDVELVKDGIGATFTEVRDSREILRKQDESHELEVDEVGTTSTEIPDSKKACHMKVEGHALEITCATAKGQD